MPGPRLRHELWELQEGRCLYSGAILADPAVSAARQVALDHVVPWSRHRLSHLENLVLVTSSMNSQKRNLPLGPQMLQRWLAHLNTHHRRLASIAHDHGWPTDTEQTLKVSRSMYRIATTVTVWDGP